ncbi:6-phosphogluconate dehydrogenase, decarboxylating, partial [Haematococcus lacustris]
AGRKANWLCRGTGLHHVAAKAPVRWPAAACCLAPHAHLPAVGPFPQLASRVSFVEAGAPVDQTIVQLSKYMEAGDIIIDGGNEWYENTQRRKEEVAKKGLLYLGMGVSGGEEGARRGPSMMPGGSAEAYTHIKDIVEKVAAQPVGQQLQPAVEAGVPGHAVLRQQQE